MYGKGDSKLSVIRKGFNSVLNGTVLWTDMKNNGDVWVSAQVSISNNFTGNYILLFEGVSGPSALGDIGLDDIKITTGDCPNLCAYQCQNGTCLSEQQVCNFVNDCLNGEEELKCGYNVTFETDFNG